MAFDPPEYLSPSSINTFLQCPLRFKYTRIDGVREPPTEATLLGNFVHDILEGLYRLESTERTLTAARGLARSLWEETYKHEVVDFVPEHKLSDFRWRAWFCVENLWKIEDPQITEFDGLEQEVNADVSGVRIKGFIDRLKIDTDGVTISDYKTGKVPNAKWSEGKFFQLLIYAALVQELGFGKVKDLELVYLKDPVTLKKQISQSDVNQTVQTLIEVKQNIDECCKHEDFPYKKSRLCDWCAFKAKCPAWSKVRSNNE